MNRHGLVHLDEGMSLARAPPRSLGLVTNGSRHRRNARGPLVHDKKQRSEANEACAWQMPSLAIRPEYTVMYMVHRMCRTVCRPSVGTRTGRPQDSNGHPSWSPGSLFDMAERGPRQERIDKGGTE